MFFLERRTPLKGLTCTNYRVMKQLASGMILVGKGLQNSWGRFCPGEFREKRAPSRARKNPVKVAKVNLGHRMGQEMKSIQGLLTCHVIQSLSTN